MPHLGDLWIDEVEAAATGVLIRASAQAAGAVCPSSCGSSSSRVHGRHERTLLDLPAAGREVLVRLSVRRFPCTASTCPVVTSVEQVAELTARWARQPLPTTAMLARIGLVLAGRAGARLAGGWA